MTTVPADADAILVWADRPASPDLLESLLTRAAAGTPVLLAGPTAAAYADTPAVVEAAGIVPGAQTPAHETRLRPGPAGAAATRRIAGDVIVTDRWLALEKVRDDVEVLVTAMSGLTEHAVMTWRAATGVGVFSTGTTAATLGDSGYRLLVQRWLRHALGLVEAPDIRVGVLGYGAIGHEHNQAISRVDGLVLSAVCDQNPTRIDAARTLAPDVLAFADGEQLLASDEVDLVIVSTPPSSHAEWALRAIG